MRKHSALVSVRAVRSVMLHRFMHELRPSSSPAPGESDMDQLYLILRCFGNLCDSQSEWLRKHPL